MKPAFHVYIDEAGDPGVKPKLTVDPSPTDWFVISAVVVSDEREPDIVGWVQDMGEAVRTLPANPLHYRNLSLTNRERVARMLGRKPVRLFSVASHKETMRQHVNRKLGRASDKEFYNWCLRLLLERVTSFCYRRSTRDGGEVQPARIVFSERGGHNYSELRDYLKKLEAQTLTKKLVLERRGLSPGIIANSLMEVRPHASVAGLQLADIVASSVFQGACSCLSKHSLQPALSLKPRFDVAGKKKLQANVGMMLLPFAHQGEIPPSDWPLFESFGYSFPRNG